MSKYLRNFKLKVHTLLHYEYWSAWMLYWPFLFVYLYYAIKNRSLIYMFYVNPGIEFAGLCNYSKYNVLNQLPSDVKPKTYLIRSDAVPTSAQVLEAFTLPFIVKPDFGERGKDVRLIKTALELDNFLQSVSQNYIVQAYVDYPLEFGVFYSKKGINGKPTITSVTGKEFLIFKGDGKTTLSQFITNNPRVFKRAEYFKAHFAMHWNEVLPLGHTLFLEHVGNHNRGTIFLDKSALITPQMVQVFDRIAKNINGFCHGRFDVRVATVNDLYTGERLQILEANGINSEVTHIYDPGYKLVNAYRAIFRHFKLAGAIAQINKQHKVKPVYYSLSQFAKVLWIRLLK